MDENDDLIDLYQTCIDSYNNFISNLCEYQAKYRQQAKEWGTWNRFEYWASAIMGVIGILSWDLVAFGVLFGCTSGVVIAMRIIQLKIRPPFELWIAECQKAIDEAIKYRDECSAALKNERGW